MSISANGLPASITHVVLLRVLAAFFMFYTNVEHFVSYCFSSLSLFAKYFHMEGGRGRQSQEEGKKKKKTSKLVSKANFLPLVLAITLQVKQSPGAMRTETQ